MAIARRSAGPGASAGGGSRRSLGLVLAGGGARGFAHAGVLRGLETIGVAPDVVVGVSMGAVVGVTYALREDWYDALAEMDTSGFPGPHKLFAGEDASWPERARTVGAASRIIWDMIVGWGIGARSVEFGRSMLRDLTLDMRLEDARIPVAVGATDLTTGERVVLRSGSAAEAIYASSALAGIVPPLRRDGRVLCDGTYADSAPIDVARALGAAVVVAVDPGQDLTAGPIRSGVHALLRALDICHTQHDALRFGAADFVLKPCFARSIDTLEFDARRECLAAGLCAVRASRRELESLAGANLRNPSPGARFNRAARRPEPLGRPLSPRSAREGRRPAVRPPYTKIRIEGLSCLGGGAANLERALARLPGIAEVYVNPATEVAYLRYDADALSVPAILEAIERAGYRGVLLEPRETTGRVDTRAAP